VENMVFESLLNEASILDEARRIVEVTIIKPGPAKACLDQKPVSYTEQALRDSLPLWEGAACFCDHWNKSVRNIAGVFFAPWYDERVAALLREAALTGRDGDIAVPVNCGQEPWDVVEITDPRCFISSQKMRVSGLGISYSTSRPLYTLRIELGAL